MGVLIEINAGPMAGKKIAIATGQAVTFGRSGAKAQVALAHDTFMSGLHFAVECGTSGCRVLDRRSSNGTFLNGAKIQDAMLANGDEIKGGQTVFSVKIVPDAKLASMVPATEVGLTTSGIRRRRSPGSSAGVPAAPRAEEKKPASVKLDARPARARAEDPETPERRPAAEKEQPRESRPKEPQPQGDEHELPSIQASNMGVPVAKPRPPIPEPPAKKTPSNIEPRKVEPSDAPPRKAEADADISARKAERRPEPPSDDMWAEPRVSEKIVPRSVEESPKVRAIPDVPRVEEPRAAEPPRAEVKPAEAEPKKKIVPPPPVGVASHIARKFGDGPLERGDGSRPGGPAFSVMGWSFPTTPPEWQVQEGFGLQQSGNEEFPGSVAATEESLGGITLQQFVESQISMLRGYLRDPKIEPTMPPRVGGADESLAMDVRHSTKDGRELVYRRIYARSGASVGVLTVTTLATELPQVLRSLQPLLDGAAFRATVNH